MKKNHLRNKVRLPHMSKMRVMKKGFTLFTPLVGMVILVISLVIIVNIINTEKTRVSVIVDYQSSLKESATIDFAKIDAIHTIMFEYKNQLHNMFLKKYFENDLAGAIDLSNDRRNLCNQLKLFIESGVKTDVLTNLSTNVFKSAGTLKNVDSDQLENIGEYSLGLFGTFTNYDVTFLPSDCFSSKDGSFAVEVKPNSNLSSNEVAKIIILNNLTGEKSNSFIIPEEGLILPIPIRFIKAADVAISIQEKLFDGVNGIKPWGVCDLQSSGAGSCDCELKDSVDAVECKIYSETKYFGETTKLDCTKEQSSSSESEFSLPSYVPYSPKNVVSETDFEKNCLDSSYDFSPVDVGEYNYASNEITVEEYTKYVADVIGEVLISELDNLSSVNNMEFSPLFFKTEAYMDDIKGASSKTQFFVSGNNNSNVVFPTKYFKYDVDKSSFPFDGCLTDSSYVTYENSSSLKPSLCAQMTRNAKLCFSLVDKGLGIPGKSGNINFEPEDNFFVYHPIKEPIKNESGVVSVPFAFCVSIVNNGEDSKFVYDNVRNKLKEEWENATENSVPSVEGVSLECLDNYANTSSSCDICNDSGSKNCL